MDTVAPEKTTTRPLQLEASWQQVLGDEFSKDYMKKLRQFLVEEKQRGKVIYPPGPLIFNALNATPFDQVKVVILGQDPYHGPNQAHGLCFSVQAGVALPPSLKNIFIELKQDLGVDNDKKGCLQAWAEQGVLLLNSVLTVERGQAAAHQGKGWEQFTDVVIEKLNEQRSGLVFILWGGYAQRKGAIIDPNKHLVLRSPHPSPLSAYQGFFGQHHFSQANDYLGKEKAINWQL